MEFGYDYLIVAAGVQQSYFGHDEYAQCAPGMKTIEHALNIRRRVFGAFEMADTADDPAERGRWLTFALVGAGPTGVELAGQIREVATKTLRDEYRHIKPEDARVLLFDGGTPRWPRSARNCPAKAARQPGQARRRAAHALDRDRHGRHRAEVTRPGRQGDPPRGEHRAVDRRGGGAAAAAAVAGATGAKQDRAGRIMVGEDCTIPDHPEILVTGDVMSLNKLPGVCEVAMQTGMYAGRTHQARGHRGRCPPSRSATATWARRLTCPAGTRSSRFRAELRGFLGWASGCSSTSAS